MALDTQNSVEKGHRIQLHSGILSSRFQEFRDWSWKDLNCEREAESKVKLNFRQPDWRLC